MKVHYQKFWLNFCDIWDKFPAGYEKSSRGYIPQTWYLTPPLSSLYQNKLYMVNCLCFESNIGADSIHFSTENHIFNSDVEERLTFKSSKFSTMFWNPTDILAVSANMFTQSEHASIG